MDDSLLSSIGRVAHTEVGYPEVTYANGLDASLLDSLLRQSIPSLTRLM